MENRYCQQMKSRHNHCGNEDVALINADELTSILETAHLLRSPSVWSRRITQEHRIVYGGGHERIDFIQACCHY